MNLAEYFTAYKSKRITRKVTLHLYLVEMSDYVEYITIRIASLVRYIYVACTSCTQHA